MGLNLGDTNAEVSNAILRLTDHPTEEEIYILIGQHASGCVKPNEKMPSFDWRPFGVPSEYIIAFLSCISFGLCIIIVLQILIWRRNKINRQ